MRGLPIALILGVAALAGSSEGLAASVKGTVTLPATLKAPRRYNGYVRIENGMVPTEPAPYRGDTVVVVNAGRANSLPAKTISVDLAGLTAVPSLVVVGEGSVVEFKNTDRVPHDLSTPEQFSLMPIERLSPGNIRRQKFAQTGGYVVQCAEYPQLRVSVLVLASSSYAIVDEKGGFKLADVPEGSATLKVWSQGRWVHEDQITIGRDQDVTVKVSPQGGRDSE